VALTQNCPQWSRRYKFTSGQVSIRTVSVILPRCELSVLRKARPIPASCESYQPGKFKLFHHRRAVFSFPQRLRVGAFGKRLPVDWAMGGAGCSCGMGLPCYRGGIFPAWTAKSGAAKNFAHTSSGGCGRRNPDRNP